MGLAISPDVSATAIALSNIGFSNLLITPATGTVELQDDWTVEGFANAQNSLGENDAHDQLSYPGGTVAADATVTWAAGHGDASAASPPDLSVAANASSAVNLPGCDTKAAQSSGLGTLTNTLAVTGGTGTTAVNLAGDIAGLLHVLTDSCGLQADSEVIFRMEIFGLPDIGTVPQNPLVLFSDQHFTIGPNAEIIFPFAQTLTGSATLAFDTPYSFLIQVDSESSGVVVVPEPATPALLLAGVAFLLKRRRLQ